LLSELERLEVLVSLEHDELLASKGKYYQLYTGNQITE
jgi:hypothetical protein